MDLEIAIGSLYLVLPLFILWWAIQHVSGRLLKPRPAVGPKGLSIATTRLIRHGWLTRCIEVSMPDGDHRVEYDGRGFGYEQVSVDGFVTRRFSHFWFVPRFELALGGHAGVIEVRVWPWLALRSLVLTVDDRVVYAEGAGGWDMKPTGSPDPWDELA